MTRQKRAVDAISRRFKKKEEILEKLQSKNRIPKTLLWLNFFLVFLIIFALFIKFESKPAKAKFELANFLSEGKFLVLFLNHTELRGAGGFIGSYARVETSNREIKKFDFETNIYTSDKKLAQKIKIAPPPIIAQYLELDNWYMRDSNWLLDFEAAAQTAAWFDLQKRGLIENDLDGVIALDSKFFTEFLKLIGPFTLDEGTKIDSENFISLIQYKVEKEYFEDKKNWSENQPKKILKELFEKLTRELGKEILGDYRVQKLIQKNFREKHLVLFSFKEETQREIRGLNWGGTIRQPTDDNENKNYLFVANTNLGGKKSSAKIKEDIFYETRRENDKIVADLKITRVHTGSFDWPDGENRNYLRILVPFGATLINADLDNLDIKDQINRTNESKKTSFGFWLLLEPQETKTLKLKYQLPANVNIEKIIIQKQVGSVNEKIKIIKNGKTIYDGELKKDLEF